ncbi:MAG: Asp-tRNA(Asn)/Glu-tRNA(Gln) amidotransferase GatCAB subunit C [Hyphomicrobiaceae bacterium TMED74]|nr:Asp-tRNA(Asn)/Glu-tRNA(Gln) amidotransferase GatCAB subunit C [Filomicrobium sp.]RPG42233.1 MAG: Asp-tRNA(Asn)/Glu-tRNA(Gln) amidotransferase GatCAB subunit C [Hyphomicrobiaceae bacterium TMED74]
MDNIHSSHWGAFEAIVEDGQLKEARPFERDVTPSPILNAIPEAVHHPVRVVRPSIREGWLKNRDRNRGNDRFVEVPWDEALDIVAEELQRVKREHGNEAIFAGSYGWSSAGRFHHAKTQMQRFMNCFGGYTDQKHNYSLAAGLAILPHIVGDVRPLRQATSYQAVAEATELLIAFGGVGTRNAQVEPGGMGVHTTDSWLRKLADKGLDLISVTPLRSDTPEYMNADWWAVRPNTDVALMLGLAHTLVSEELHSPEFLEKYAVGYGKFEAYLLGKTDGQAKTADWASAICEIEAERIRELARKMASKRTFLATSYSLQRSDHGEQTFWMTMTLAAILGQIGLPGGGFSFGFGSMHGQGNPVAAHLPVSHSAGQNPTGSFIPVARIADLLLNPGQEYDFDGERRRYPETKIIYWCGGNPFHHHQDLNRLVEGWRRPDTVIVNEPFWTPTAKLADIVLPATTTLERNDIGASSRDRFVMAMKKAVEPQGKARHDFEIFRGLAQRVGVEREFAMDRNAMEWLRTIYETARQRVSEVAGEIPDFDTFWANGYVETDMPETPYNVYSDYRSDPEGAKLPTPSGKLEIFSETIDGFGYDDCIGHPIWMEPAEWLGSDQVKAFPLHLMSNQPQHKLHSQMDFAGPSKEEKVGGREVAVLSSVEAAKRGIATGDIIRLFNNRGETLASAKISDDVREGVILLPTGAWFDPASLDGAVGKEKHGNPNVLTLDKGTSRLGQGSIAHTTLVEVEKFEGTPPEVTAFVVPEIVPLKS